MVIPSSWSCHSVQATAVGPLRRCWGTASSLAQPVCWWPCPATPSLSSSASDLPTSRPTSCWLRVIAGRLGRVCSVHLFQCFHPSVRPRLFCSPVSVFLSARGLPCHARLVAERCAVIGRSGSVLFTCLSVLIRQVGHVLFCSPVSVFSSSKASQAHTRPAFYHR